MDQTYEPYPPPPATAEQLGTNQSGMRASNERLVLTMIRRKGALAKSDIARMTGLSAQTVSVIMRSLEAEGLLVKREPQRGKVGQPSVPMGLNPKGAFFLGLKIGRRSAEVILIDFLGEIVARTKQIYRYPDFDSILRFVEDSDATIRAGMDPAHARRIEGLGIAIPFQLWDWARAIGVDAEKMSGWKDRSILDEIQAKFGIPVSLQNDATAACSAEMVFGTAAAPANFLSFYIGFFIGGGVVLNNGLLAGPSGSAGAVGPMRVPDTGGGITQLMDVASLVVLEDAMAGAGLDPARLWSDPEDWDAPQDLLDAWVRRAGAAIAHAVQNAVAVIDFEAIVIDGWLPARVRDAVVEQVRQALDALDFTGLNRPEIRPGTVGPDARALGAASQPLVRRFLIDAT